MSNRTSSPNRIRSACEIAWGAIDRAAQAETGNTTVDIDLTFEGNTVTSWYHPKLAPIMCALCGKGCREAGKMPCVRINPYCG